MSLIGIILVIAVVGIVLWAVNQIPMHGTVKRILNAVVVIILVIWLLGVFGLIDPILGISVG